MISAWMEALFEWRAVRWTAAIAFLCRGGLWWAVGRRYRAMVDFCWVVRVSNVPSLQRLAERVVFGVLAEAKRTGHNPLVDWYRADRASQECAELFSLTGHGSADLLRDLIVLKSAAAGRERRHPAEVCPDVQCRGRTVRLASADESLPVRSRTVLGGLLRSRRC